MKNRRGATIIDLAVALTVVIIPILFVVALIILRKWLA